MPCNTNFTLDTIENLSVFKQNPKLLVKLKLNTSEDNFYETHQLYKTIHFRCVSNDLIDEGIDLIFNGIVYFSNKNQLHCINDLAKVFVESLKKSSKQTPESIDSDFVSKIKLIHSCLKDGIEEQNEFAVAILKWSGSLFNKYASIKTINQENNLLVYQKNFGHVDLHREIALNLWNEKNYIKSRYHFLHSTDGKSFSNMMIECHLKYGYPNEVDLFLTQSVLQYLCLRNYDTAFEFYNHFKINHPLLIDQQQQQKKTELPLLNFLNFLFISIKTCKVNVFNVLIDIYKPSLDRDKSFIDYLDRIGQYFFNLKPKKVEKENMFSNLMRMLVTNTNTNNSTSQNNEVITSINQINSTNNNDNNSNNEEDEDDEDWNSLREEDIDDNDLLD
jgi:hypothetical protein